MESFDVSVPSDGDSDLFKSKQIMEMLQLSVCFSCVPLAFGYSEILQSEKMTFMTIASREGDSITRPGLKIRQPLVTNQKIESSFLCFLKPVISGVECVKLHRKAIDVR
jgi:hypothetical protein